MYNSMQVTLTLRWAIIWHFIYDRQNGGEVTTYT